MLLSMISAILACFLWGFIFIAPQFFTTTPLPLIAFSRYAAFAITSLCIWIIGRRWFNWRCNQQQFQTALLFSFFANVVNYSAVVFAIHYSSPALAALIVGFTPITTTLYGNSCERSLPYRSLFLPLLFIAIGLILIHLPKIDQDDSFQESTNLMLAISFCLISLCSWTWYVTANSRYLKGEKALSPIQWTTLNGVATAVWSLLLLPLFIAMGWISLSIFDSEERFLLLKVGLFLGIVSSWASFFLWSFASKQLPGAMMGQLNSFETIFAILFSYILEQRAPLFLEAVGTVMILIATIQGYKITQRVVGENVAIAH